MSERNAKRRHRPLRGGIRIVNEVIRKAGTLGFVAVDPAGAERWIVSCYHVLARPAGQPAGTPPFLSGERIYQPSISQGGPAIALTDDTRADRALDCAAARVEPGVDCVGEILALGPIRPISGHQTGVGDRVVKSGTQTGVTEGRISAIDADRIRIEPLSEFANDYILCEDGDSGALWLDQQRMVPVGMHVAGGSRLGRAFAEAVPIDRVLAMLRLAILP